MKEFTYTIKDKMGIHARPAAVMAKEAKNYGDTVITVNFGDKSANASQLMKVMGLGVKCGDEVKITVEGPDEDAVAEAMEKFFEENF